MPTNLDRYAVFGNPVAQSKSPTIHSVFADQTGQHMEYKKKRVAQADFATEVERFFVEGGKGLNITVPYKLAAMQLADQLSARAEKSGAVNTLLIRDGRIYGENTDGIGLRNDLENNLRWGVEASNVLLLGAGGAVRGVLSPLLALKPKQLLLANRSSDKAIALANLFEDEATKKGVIIEGLSFEALHRRSKNSAPLDIVINGTSASLTGELPEIDTALVNGACCYDMMYAAAPTSFLQWAAKHGAESTADGLGMLVEQAAESFFIWRGVRPSTRPVIELLRNAF